MTDVSLYNGTLDREGILKHLNLDPRDTATQALLLMCERYQLDPLRKHMVLIKGNPYVTRDGYLHIAHASGQFDGLEVVETGEDDAHWWAKVSVYRRDMGRPFTFVGRYPKADAGHMKKYGPEMAIKVAEVQALRRAFDVGGIGAADEQWDTPDSGVVAVELASQLQLVKIRAGIAALPSEVKHEFRNWWKQNRFPGIDTGNLTAAAADEIIARIDELVGVTDGTIWDRLADPDDDIVDADLEDGD